MKRFDRALDGLIEHVNAWGGNVRWVTPAAFNSLFWSRDRAVENRAYGYHVAPAANGLGVHVPTLTIYSVRSMLDLGAMIHEAGHLFGDPREEINPQHADEWAWMGWEIALARRLDIFEWWSTQNENYGLGDPDLTDDDWGGIEWGGLGKKDQDRVARERVGYAQLIGIVDKHKRPLSMRPYVCDR